MNDALMVIVPAFLGGFGTCCALGVLLFHRESVGVYNDGFDEGFSAAHAEVCAMQTYAYRELVADPGSEKILATLDAVEQGLRNSHLEIKRGRA
jgi:hypothetical protein